MNLILSEYILSVFFLHLILQLNANALFCLAIITKVVMIPETSLLSSIRSTVSQKFLGVVWTPSLACSMLQNILPAPFSRDLLLWVKRNPEVILLFLLLKSKEVARAEELQKSVWVSFTYVFTWLQILLEDFKLPWLRWLCSWTVSPLKDFCLISAESQNGHSFSHAYPWHVQNC